MWPLLLQGQPEPCTPHPPDQPGSCWTFGHLREGWKRYPLTSLQCKRPSSPRPSVATPLQRRPYFPTESGLRFPLYPACSVPGVIHILLQVRLVVPHPSPVSDSELPESMLCLPQYNHSSPPQIQLSSVCKTGSFTRVSLSMNISRKIQEEIGRGLEWEYR